jgi:hypothetical protein
MNLHVLLVVGFVLSATGCAEIEQVVPEPVDDAQMTAPEAVAPTAENESWRNDTFLAHMHHHAERLDDLNFALADGDLEATMIPARWLSRHDNVGDVQSDWQPYLSGMRLEAEVVENASDLETARAAAERINDQCQSCHAAIGISTQ